MKGNEMETTLSTKSNRRIFIDSWDDNGVWFGLREGSASMSVTLTNEEAKALIEALQKAMEFENA